MVQNRLRTLNSQFIPGPLHLIDARGYPTFSVYRYESAIREIILAAKVKSDYVCMQFICDEFSRFFKNATEFHKCDYVLAAPSSLWSRWRLRFNVANAMSKVVKDTLGISIVQLPYTSYFRTSKRAKVSNKRWTNADLKVRDLTKVQRFQHLKGKRLLIVDDIVTSGLTLATIAGQFPGVEIKLLVFASARNE